MNNKSNNNWMNQPSWPYIVGLVFVLYLFFKFYDPSSSTRSKSAVYNLSPYELLNEYKSNEAAADKKYLGKIISVSGAITDISSEDIRLNEDVVCNFEGKEKDKLANLHTGDRITIKGECAGKFLWTVHLKYSIIQ